MCAASSDGNLRSCPRQALTGFRCRSPLRSQDRLAFLATPKPLLQLRCPSLATNSPLDCLFNAATLSGSIPILHKIKKRRRMSSLFYGAGDGNRTHTTSLVGWSSTTKLHLHIFCHYQVAEIIIYFLSLFVNRYLAYCQFTAIFSPSAYA